MSSDVEVEVSLPEVELVKRESGGRGADGREPSSSAVPLRKGRLGSAHLTTLSNVASLGLSCVLVDDESPIVAVVGRKVMADGGGLGWSSMSRLPRRHLDSNLDPVKQDTSCQADCRLIHRTLTTNSPTAAS